MNSLEAKPPGERRDPLTGEAGSHPVGAGLGAAVGGAAAGVVSGAMAGPVGAVVGAALGAVLGGLAGSDLAETLDPEGLTRDQPLHGGPPQG